MMNSFGLVKDILLGSLVKELRLVSEKRRGQYYLLQKGIVHLVIISCEAT